MHGGITGLTFGEVAEQSQWIDGFESPQLPPAISVIGVFDDADDEAAYQSMLSSLLAQTYEDLEIILVDDSRGHRVYETERAILESDQRIKLLLHPEPIGLPGFSLAEAILRARGRYLLFALNGVVFSATALEDLLQASRDADSVGTGTVITYGKINEAAPSGAAPHVFYPEALRYNDYIKTSALLIPYALVGICGLPDPQLAMRTHAIWDYCRRLSEAAIVKPVEVEVGRQAFQLLADRLESGLGALASEHLPFLRGRTDLLPDTIGAYPVFRNDSRNRVCGSDGTLSAAVVSGRTAPNLLVVGRLESSISLVFDEFRDRTEYQISYIEPWAASQFDALRVIANSAAIIVSRFLHPDTEFEKVYELAESLAVPCYYYADDNFCVLSDERTDFSWYTVENMRARLARMSGVLLTSWELVHFYKENSLHDRIYYVSPSLDEFLVKLLDRIDGIGAVHPQYDEGIRIGFVGHAARVPQLRSVVIPAIEAATKGVSCTLCLAPGVHVETKLPIRRVPAHRCFKDFVLEWRKSGVDVIIHSSVGQSRNVRYKTANAILSTYYLGAVPIVSDEPAYANLTGLQGVTVVGGDDVNVWARSIRDHLDPERRRQMRKRLERFVRSAFGGEQNDAVFREIVAGTDGEPAEARYLRALRGLLPR